VAAAALLAASSVARSDYALPGKDVRTLASGEQRYDATTQPGNELFQRIDDSVADADPRLLTFSIYDVCVGRIAHRVKRDGPVNPVRVTVTDPATLTAKIKDDSIGLGAEVVGVTELDRRFVFEKDNDGRPVSLPHTVAIVIGVGLDYKLSNPTAPLPWQQYYSAIPEDVAAVLSGRAVRTATTIPESTLNEYRDTLEFFADGGRIAVQIAEQIRSLGYPARAHFGRWSEVQVLPLAVMAGLGEVAKNGMLVSPAFGPRGSFPVVTTTLPLVPDRQRDLGIQEFCRVCSKCARACPVQAVPSGQPVPRGGLLRWPVDGDKCFSYIKDNPKCMACIGSCPFNKPDYPLHRAANWLIARKSIVANKLLVALDDLLGYGRASLAIPKAPAQEPGRAPAGEAAK